MVDARCRDLTSRGACEKGRANPGSVPLCDFHEVFSVNCIEMQSNIVLQGLEGMEPGNLIPSGIWTLADVLNYGREKGVCPYFTIRRMVSYRISF